VPTVQEENDSTHDQDSTGRHVQRVVQGSQGVLQEVFRSDGDEHVGDRPRTVCAQAFLGGQDRGKGNSFRDVH